MNPHPFRIHALRESVDDGYPKINIRASNRQYPDGVNFVTKRNRKYPVFDCIEKDGLCVSERARKVLEGFGVPGLEIEKPILVNDQPFYAFCRSRIVDCLNHQQSLLQFYPSDPNRVMKVNRYRFRRRQLNEIDIFSIPEERSCRPYVTSAVKNSLETAGLIGFWMPEMEDYRDPATCDGVPYRYENDLLNLAIEIPRHWTMWAWSNNCRKLLQPGDKFFAKDFTLPSDPSKNSSLFHADFESIDRTSVRHAGVSVEVWGCEPHEDVGDSFIDRDKDETIESQRTRRRMWDVNGIEFTYVDHDFESQGTVGTRRFAWRRLSGDCYLLAHIVGYRPEYFDAVRTVFERLRPLREIQK